METASSHVAVPSSSKEGEDRLSELCDDVLLSILQLLDLRTLLRVGALSRRWRHLPRLLPDITINAWDLPARCRQYSTCEADQIMAAYTAAARWFLLPSTPRRSIRSIKLGFYLTDPYLRIIGDLVGDVVRSGGATQRLEFVIPADIITETHPSDELVLLFGQRFASFFNACPTAFGCLTHLTLEQLCFGDDVPTLLTTCKKLRSLSLSYCDFGPNCIMEVDTPDSELVYLRLDSCSFGRIDLIHAPKLERVCCDTWFGGNPPVIFGRVPRLHRIDFASPFFDHQEPILLTEWLSSARSLSTLYLNFCDQMIWVQPEGRKQLASIFSGLRDVHLYNIFRDCDLDWTLFVVEAAPLLKNLHILICRHICDINDWTDTAERTNVQWQPSDFNHKNLSLLEVQGFVVEKKVMRYVRLVIKRSPSLKRIRLLKQAPCEECATFNRHYIFPETKWRFPEQEREKVWCRDRLMDGQRSSAEIFIEE